MRGQGREPVGGTRRRLLGGAGLAGAALATGLGTARAGGGADIVGAWLVRVPQPSGPDYEAVAIYTLDGIVLTPFAPGDVSANEGPSLGAGVWAAAGEGAVAFSFVAPLYDATGGGAGQARVQGRFTLGEDGAGASGPVRITILASDGTVRERTPLLLVTATRIDLEPLEP